MKYLKPLFPKGAFKITTRTIKKKYAFELPNIPYEETEYLNIQYDAKYPYINDTTFKSDTIEHIFGSNTSSVENLILNRQIMGPCWLRIMKPQNMTSPISYCKFESSVVSPNNIVVIKDNIPPSPTLSIASISLKTIVNNDHRSEIVAISVMFHNNVNCDTTTPNKKATSHFTAVRPIVGKYMDLKKEDIKNNNIQICQNETSLLNYFIAQITQHDPDVIMGHNILGYDLDVILHSMNKNNGVKNWSKIGRIKRSIWPNASKNGNGKDHYFGQLTCGRLIIDTYLSAKELIKDTTYSLYSLSKSMIDTKKFQIADEFLEDIDPMDVPLYYNKSENLQALIHHNEIRAFLTLQIMFSLELVSLTKQITNISGNLWSSTLKGNRAGRIEYLLLHRFYNEGYIVPDKENMKQKVETTRNSNRKAKYEGGYVLEPKAGLYEKYIVVLDFNSLYPSIIQEFNLCFTTVERPRYDDKKKESDDDFKAEIPKCDVDVNNLAILPKTIQYLVKRRREVKNLLKNTKDEDHLLKSQLNTKQLAFKILANSMYGCLGFTASRFYAKSIASLVTSKGREILCQTIQIAENEGYSVIYGDTDSIMINTNTTNYMEYILIYYIIQSIKNW